MTRTIALLTLLLMLATAAGVWAADDEDQKDEEPKDPLIPAAGSAALEARKSPVLPDPVIRDRLAASMWATKTVGARDVRATVKDGAVTLRGKVDSIAERNLVDAVARTSPGVRSVRNDLRVVKRRDHPWPAGDPRSVGDVIMDQKLEKEVRRRIGASGLVRSADLRVDVHMNVVVLSGPVPSGSAREKNPRTCALHGQGPRRRQQSLGRRNRIRTNGRAIAIPRSCP
ncbi:MAG: BON domain-containing protein [Deltaproteobacteria bacterium]|nr:BON domain-containing protein [Deltaproteobacteria bacterium]